MSPTYSSSSTTPKRKWTPLKAWFSPSASPSWSSLRWELCALAQEGGSLLFPTRWIPLLFQPEQNARQQQKPTLYKDLQITLFLTFWKRGDLGERNFSSGVCRHWDLVLMIYPVVLDTWFIVICLLASICITKLTGTRRRDFKQRWMPQSSLIPS